MCRRCCKLADIVSEFTRHEGALRPQEQWLRADLSRTLIAKRGRIGVKDHPLWPGGSAACTKTAPALSPSRISACKIKQVLKNSPLRGGARRLASFRSVSGNLHFNGAALMDIDPAVRLHSISTTANFPSQMGAGVIIYALVLLVVGHKTGATTASHTQ